jgi:hypothetical protein
MSAAPASAAAATVDLRILFITNFLFLRSRRDGVMPRDAPKAVYKVFSCESSAEWQIRRSGRYGVKHAEKSFIAAHITRMFLLGSGDHICRRALLSAPGLETSGKVDSIRREGDATKWMDAPIANILTAIAPE